MFLRKTASRVLFFLVAAKFAAAAEVTIAPDGMIVADGQRLFVLGLYENPDDNAVLDELARAGFNLVRASEDTAVLDRLDARGVYAWVNTGGRIELSEDSEEGEKALLEMVARCSLHPALLVWEVPDEALWSCWLGAYRGPGSLLERWMRFKEEAAKLSLRLKRGYDKLRELDPGHPVWMNHAAGNSLDELRAFGQAADVVGCDIYPLMPYVTRPVDISRSLLGLVGHCTIRMQASAPEKPVWMVLQGFSWGEVDDVFVRRPGLGQLPDYGELRFMAYDAIVRGARGILYWGTHLLAKDSATWKNLMRVIRELADIQHVLAAPDAAGAAVVETRLFGFRVLNASRAHLAVHALGKNVQGTTWWIIVNELPLPCAYVLRGLDAPDHLIYEESTNGTSITVRDGALGGALPPYGVHVLKPMPEP